MFAVLFAVVLGLPPIGELVEGDTQFGPDWHRWQWLQLAGFAGMLLSGVLFWSLGYRTPIVAVYTAVGLISGAGILYLGRIRPQMQAA